MACIRDVPRSNFHRSNVSTLLVLFFSDIHFGKKDRANERKNEAVLIDCLAAHQKEVTHLYLLGDVFHQYIEYRHLIPKGFVRFQALLAEWTDAGIPVTYLVGNHDPWHRDYFEQELGVRVVFDPFVVTHFEHEVYLAHGDGLVPGSRYNILKPILRHPIPVWVYRAFLPGDLGYDLAKWYLRMFGSRGSEPNPKMVVALREHARQIVTGTSARYVIMGHSHGVEQSQWEEGRYINLGAWYETGTFARLDERSLTLFQWNGSHAVAVELASANLAV